MREAEVGRELEGVCFCDGSAVVILDRGAKMPDNWKNENSEKKSMYTVLGMH